ncbi:MAG: hypothetical protein A2622_09265 [Bdellovibrionales bacterium RIFCSPHIGHO2_01_FULL_40_29]|nr:MAG: hypothetical protein A2622_09265 [Bdellovibrionales bacterium RIFCSPHIGHO2_01_FULL_40_29]OFZ33586.1 MAG: hypothetical protein A3D17_00360 [Bdellovibrionales bacterium RIFCSPHIGHO2_02_FULL_40_15]
MFKSLFLTLIISLTLNIAKAATITCQVKINGALISQKVIHSELDTKSNITQRPELTAHVTEKSKQFFTIEAFLPSYDARIYAEGHLKNTADKVAASLWGRDILVDLECGL